MFERLAQQVLSKFLSKYFTEESLAENKIYTSTQLGVWSGYVSLQNLELKKEYVNSKLRSKGMPFEIVHCSFRRVEITIPWAKLSNPIGSKFRQGKEGAVVVVVMDGIHLLARTSFDFDDIALRKAEVEKRRKVLADPYKRVDVEAEKISYKAMLKKRLKDGLLQEIASKIHVHLRDLHFRLEDVESDPMNPYACGVTLESMHIQHDDDGDAMEGVVAKMAQLNHLAVYWNALGYGDGLPVENSVLHQTCRRDTEKLSRSLNFCIARRASIIASPSRNPYIPTHTYLLLPVDGTWQGCLSTNPTDLSNKPAVAIVISIDPVFGQLRDFQCVQILRLASEYSNHKYVKRYRRFRPLVSVKESPKAWWLYAARAIRYQLRESFLRWSWARFVGVYSMRNRYMSLYERKLLYPVPTNNDPSNSEANTIDEAILTRSRHANGSIDIPTEQMDADSTNIFSSTAPDEGAGPTSPTTPRKGPLTKVEARELQDLEDGLEGDISIDTILLFRAVVNTRLGQTTAPTTQSTWRDSLFWSSTVKNGLVDDSEAKAELESLLNYLNKTSESSNGPDTGNEKLTAVSVIVRFEELSLSLLSPLAATASESLLRQIHEKYLEFSISDLRFGYALRGDYESKELQLSMLDLVGTEIRDDGSQHLVVKHMPNRVRGSEQDENDEGGESRPEPLLVMTMAQSASNNSGCDVALVVFANKLEFTLMPECEWISHVRSMVYHITKAPSVADYWKTLSLAYVNSLALGRLGLIAKAESAGTEHRNLDAEITIQCPILRIGDGDGGHFIIDLGLAHFKTERLAGVPTTETLLAGASEGSHPGDASVEASLPRVDDASVIGSVAGRIWGSRSILETPTNNRKRSDRQFAFSSGMSVDSRSGWGNRSTSGSLFFDEPLVRTNVVEEEMDEERKDEAKTWNYLFYDVFSFHLQTGKITFCGESDVFDVMCGVEVYTVIKKSVIPADHTLCKLKAHTVVKSLQLELDRHIIHVAANTARTWKGLLQKASRAAWQADFIGTRRRGIRPNVLTESQGFAEPVSLDDGSTSNIDENEFFDANETNESFAGDGSAVWFEDNWISDAESLIDGESRSHSGRRGKRRRAGSISDVSSASDQSTKESAKESSSVKGRKLPPGNAYLSAENLARLEEGAGEDESIGTSVLDMDEESFHSVLSEQGQQRVVQDLEENIDQCNQNLAELSAKLRDLNGRTDAVLSGDSDRRRKERSSLKLELNRAKVELKGLCALRDDLHALMSEEHCQNGKHDKESSLLARRNAQAKNTKALLAAKRRRDLMLESDGLHKLTQDLNREIFQGSILFQDCRVTLQLNGTCNAATSTDACTFEIAASQTGLAIFHQLQDTKLYFSSDQVSAALRNKSDPSTRSKILFSGGSTDTFLPSHFPHLVSRSMEEKFIRGALHLSKRGPLDSTSRYARTLRARLVFGDMEVFPAPQILAHLRTFFFESETHNDTNDSAMAETGSDAGESIGNSTEVTQRTKAKSHASHEDIAVRFSSVRMILSSSNKIVGAAAATETAIRFVRASTATREKVQTDLRCTNLQLLDISSLEAGHGTEVFGRRDPYSAAIQLRMRSQLVPENECGGWVVGVDSRDNESTVMPAATVRNVHVGTKINPLSILAMPQAISRFRDSAEEMKSFIKSKKQPPSSAAHELDPKHSVLARLSSKNPLRWRIDLTLKRISVNFPEQRTGDWNFTEELESKMKFIFSLVCCLQQSADREKHLSVSVALTEIAVLRSLDDWPILEQFTFLGEATIETHLLAKIPSSVPAAHRPALSPLKVDSGSSLNEISAIMHRYGWDSMSLQHDKFVQRGLLALITPVKANISASIIGLIADTSSLLKHSFRGRKSTSAGPNLDDVENQVPLRVRNHKQLGLHLVLEEVEVQVLREVDVKPASQAKQLISFTMTDVRMDFEQGEQAATSILIRNSSLFDLSSSRGIQVVGENTGGHEKEIPYFVRVKLYMDKQVNGQATARLEINWGSIQCLIMPTFLISLLSLKDDIQALLKRSRQGSERDNKTDLLQRFAGFGNDVTLIMSAHADAFECILSSKDIAEYVRQAGNEPIGVVTLRWKASLSVSVALDTLKGVSVPWLTLNLDGKFADSGDIGLFKDFVNRYLCQSSSRQPGSDEIGQKILNAFTARIGLSVSDLQVMRTTITGKLIKPPQKTVSYKSANRMCFVVTPPFVGEQRVTNPIDLGLTYRATGSVMADLDHHLTPLPQLEVAQVLEVKARFVDVLLYISQSSDGFTESFKTSVKPVLDILKSNDARRKRQENENSRSQRDIGVQPHARSFVDIGKSAPSLCSIELEGFQVTCVPSGASRLNESPIIKIELNHFSSGIAAVPLSYHGRGRIPRHSAKDLLAVVDTLHTTVGGWVSCEMTGHYHNRRLVAWEPFVEPWVMDLKFGLDAVEALGASQTTSTSVRHIQSPSEMRSSFDTFAPSSTNDGKDRLRDFGRLFRTPFQNSMTSKQPTNEQMLISHHDFCYLMLASTCRSTILSIMQRGFESEEEREANLFSRLPKREKLDWLRCFGFPGREDDESYSCSFVLSDSRPLNINLTGALLENVLGYLRSIKSDAHEKVAPHWIRNDSGMTLRFQEVLESDRVRRGEEAGKVTVSNGSEVPLTLKRSLSQTCDPHRAYINLEFGSFEDTVGRVKHDSFDIPKGSLSSSFFFKASAKIPVDTVGVHRYPLDRNNEMRGDASILDSRALGWIIVRVALQDGVKVVSVESPFVLKSTADASIICEIRDFNGIDLIWRCLVPKRETIDDDSRNQNGLVSIPADTVPCLHDGSYSLSVFALARSSPVDHEVELTSFGGNKSIKLKTPPPFSPQSYSRGLINEDEIALETLYPDIEEAPVDEIHLTVCSFRIGSFSGVRAAVEVPEQRMMVFRAPLSIKNCLALPIAVQVRVKIQAVTDRGNQNPGLNRLKTFLSDWEDLGILECGQSVNWTGANSTEKVQMRVRFVGTDGDNSRRFPDWSSPVYIPGRDASGQTGSRPVEATPKAFTQMRVYDAQDIPLNLSVAFDPDISSASADVSQSNIRSLSQSLSSGTRAVSIFVPYWIVDSTNQDLEFFSGAATAGQLDKDPQTESRNDPNGEERYSLGLAELLDNANFLHLPSNRSFDVMMLGDASSTRLTIRKRLARQSRNLMRRLAPPWSDPIPLQAERDSHHDITVLAPKIEKDEKGPESDDIRSYERFVLRSKVIAAPRRFGGLFGTRLIHVVNRYSILNEIGRDIEIASDYELNSAVLIRGTGVPQPFHFDDSSSVRLRFKEFGWVWSGKFSIRFNRPEVTMRLRHKLKGQTVIVTVEVVEKKGSTNMLIFRQSNHPPFRLENHTMFPLHFGQSSSRLGSEENEIDAMLLPYQSADFAWDEPELRRRVLVVKTTDAPSLPEGFTLGRFKLDKIAPGTILSLESPLFAGEIVADGPTRVLRITDASMPSLSTARQDSLNDFQHRPNEKPKATMSLLAKLTHGIGVSIVDWSPQELLYVRMEDIQVERKFESNIDSVVVSAGNIKLNNQIWVTPYPVLLKMGRRVDALQPLRRKNRRHDAINVSWRRLLGTHGGYGNVTLLERVEISSEPIFVNVDGHLADLLFTMGKQISRIRRGEQQGDSALTRDEELEKVLGLPGTSSQEAETARKGFSPYQQSSDGDLMTTAAVASKLKSRPLPFVTVNSNSLRSVRSISSRKEPAVEVNKTQHKYYIEKLRISATKADISWSGPLPGLVSSLLLRALTFERLPVRLRPYFSSHAYGNAKDHLQSMKSHYLSFWRILDMLIGLSYNPTFIFRAVVYTSRETCASILDSWASEGRKCARILGSLTLKEKETVHPVFDDALQQQEVGMPMSVGRAIITPFAHGGVSIFNASATMLSFVSSLLRYGSHGSKRLAARGLVRSRNPRLFAHMDGRDMLVEYVEGENAGKALLSRVRMGMHLGEGYIFHSEGARTLKTKPKTPTDLDPSPWIVMVTSERTMLLNGKLDWDFCAVVWEAAFLSIVHLEVVLANDMSMSQTMDEVVIWYLTDKEFLEGNATEDASNVYAKALVAGVDMLDSMSVFVPHGTGIQLVRKMGSMDKRLARGLENLMKEGAKLKRD